MYKLSKYNIILDEMHQESTNTYLWNSLSGATIKMDTSALSYYHQLEQQIVFDKTSNQNDEKISFYFNTLLSNGCIIDENFNEYGRIVFDELSAKVGKNNELLSFTIAPGLGCNYKCKYCFEAGNIIHRAMNLHVQEQVIEYIEKKIQASPSVKKLRITWFGGEPLLYIEQISNLSVNLIQLCTKYGLQYSAGIITNGRFLSEKTAQKLSSLGVLTAQVSIDGLQEYYCTEKNATEEDFRKVIKNISDSSIYLNINVRINVGDSGIEEACRLTKFLLLDRELKNKIKIYIAHKRNYTNQTDEDFEKQQFRTFLKNQQEYLKWMHMQFSSITSFAFQKPLRRISSCINICESGACIGPDGELYKCEHYFGNKDYIIGNINTGNYYNFNQMKYILHQHPDKCHNCDIFPICMGGCCDDILNNRSKMCCKEYRDTIIRLKLIDIGSEIV